jgi:hypothetical protein
MASPAANAMGIAPSDAGFDPIPPEYPSGEKRATAAPAVVEANARPPAPAVSDGDSGKPGVSDASRDYVQRTMALEGSGKDPNSTAVGGFLEGTWVDLARKNLPQAAGMNDGQLLALRSDPVLRGQMTEAYAKQNAPVLVQSGFQPNQSNLRLAHWFGPEGALRILKADPSTPVSSLFSPDVITANPSLEGKTVGGVLRLVDQQMSGQTLSQSMKTLSPEVRAMMSEMDARSERDHAENLRIIQGYEKLAAAAPAGSKERMAAIDQMRKDAHRLMEQWEDTAKRPPVEKPIDMWANFGSASSIIGMLGGLFARRHLSAALSAAGTAMEAINSNNHDRFLQSYKTWEQQSNMGLKMVELQNQEIRSLLDDEKLAQDEKRSRLSTLFQEYGMVHQDQALRQSNDLRIVEMVNANERALHTATQQSLLIKQQVFSSLKAKYLADGMPDVDASARAARESGIISGGAAATDPKKQAAQAFIDQKTQETGKPPTYEDWVKFSQETGRSQTGQLSPEAVKLLAHQYEMGDPGAITSLPRSGPARVQIENQIAEDLKGMDDGAQRIVMNRLRMAEARAAATTAGRVTMNTELYAQEAVGAGQQVIETSKLFPRTSIPKFNEAIAAYERNTGDPNIIRFGTAINALVNAYGKMSNPTGTGVHDADKDRLAKIMDTALSQGQIEAGVDQIIKEGRVVSEAAQRAQGEVLGRLSPVLPQNQQAAPPAAAAAPPAGVPVPGDHVSDPDGTRYTGSDGKMYIKRGNQMVPE